MRTCTTSPGRLRRASIIRDYGETRRSLGEGGPLRVGHGRQPAAPGLIGVERLGRPAAADLPLTPQVWHAASPNCHAVSEWSKRYVVSAMSTTPHMTSRPTANKMLLANRHGCTRRIRSASRVPNMRPVRNHASAPTHRHAAPATASDSAPSAPSMRAGDSTSIVWRLRTNIARSEKKPPTTIRPRILITTMPTTDRSFCTRRLREQACRSRPSRLGRPRIHQNHLHSPERWRPMN